MLPQRFGLEPSPQQTFRILCRPDAARFGQALAASGQVWRLAQQFALPRRHDARVQAAAHDVGHAGGRGAVKGGLGGAAGGVFQGHGVAKNRQTGYALLRRQPAAVAFKDGNAARAPAHEGLDPFIGVGAGLGWTPAADKNGDLAALIASADGVAGCRHVVVHTILGHVGRDECALTDPFGQLLQGGRRRHTELLLQQAAIRGELLQGGSLLTARGQGRHQLELRLFMPRLQRQQAPGVTAHQVGPPASFIEGHDAGQRAERLDVQRLLFHSLPFFERQAAAQGKARQKIAAIVCAGLLQPADAGGAVLCRRRMMTSLGLEQRLEIGDIEAVIAVRVELDLLAAAAQEELRGRLRLAQRSP